MGLLIMSSLASQAIHAELTSLTEADNADKLEAFLLFINTSIEEEGDLLTPLDIDELITEEPVSINHLSDAEPQEEILP